MGTLGQDLSYALRVLRKSPGFTAIAVLTLALGIGVNTAIFTAVNAVLLRPVAAPELDRITVVKLDLPGLGLMGTELSPPLVEELAEGTDVFQALAAYERTDWNLTGAGEPVRLAAVRTMGDYFEVFRRQPQLGRFYTAAESEEGLHRVVVLSHGLWQQLTGGDPAVVGRMLELNGLAFEIVGVLPQDFRYPREAQLYSPLPLNASIRQNRGRLHLTPVARLQPGVTAERLDDALAARAAAWAEGMPEDSPIRPGLTATPLIEYMAGPLRPVLLVLMGAVFFVLLIACANVASLQLVRSAGRARELAVRTAVGAGRGRLLRQLFVESLLLAAAGGAGGLWLGSLLLDGISRWAAARQPALAELSLDPTVLAFTAGVSAVAALAFGLLPARRALQVQPQSVLREATRSATAGQARLGFLEGSVVVQVALALVLLVGSGLMIRSLAQLLGTDAGFRAEQLVTAQVTLPNASYGERAQRTAFVDALLERLQGTPGVQGAAAGWALPFSDQIRDSSPFQLPGTPADPDGPERHADTRIASADYFRVLGIPLLAGRTFDTRDEAGSDIVAIIDEQMARQFFPGEDPVGRQIVHAMGPATIIGVVGSVRHDELAEPRKATVYYHIRQIPIGNLAIAVRSTLDQAAVVPMLRAAVRELDPALPLYDVATMQQRVSRSLGARQLAVGALGGFAGLSLLLAMLGVYGVMRYSTNQRTREIGIRVALGALPADVLRMVVRQGMVLIAGGLALGLTAALLLTRLMEGLLYGVGARDPLTFLAVPLLLTLVALAACWLPARRASQTDPMIALRAE
jgi:putative ABC transport system permease protein